ncbi:MAG TPA: glycosyltransferase [Vicinamibacterales bacterium]|nr:glycosyltransferase [Vicinamibacterales bacterium]
MTSFIVPAWNEAGLVGATIDAIHAACRALNEPYEVIVSDDGSTDETASVADRHGARVVKVAHRQIAATRNSGAREARGEFFIFVDADTIVNETVVGAALETLRKGAVGGGAAVGLDPHVPWYAKAMMPFFVVVFRTLGLAAGCFVFCTRSAFEAIGGFDETYFGGEEIIFSRAMKQQGRFVVLRHAIMTSGRKLRTHSPIEVWAFMIRMAFRGPKGVRQREGMDLWYAPRRPDPQNGGRVFRPGESAGPEGPASED